MDYEFIKATTVAFFNTYKLKLTFFLKYAIISKVLSNVDKKGGLIK